MRAIISIPQSERSDPVTRAAFAAAHAQAQKADDPGRVALELFKADHVTFAFVARDATALGTSGGWASPLAVAGVQAFLGSLTPYSAIASLMSDGIVTSFAPGASFPSRSTNPLSYGIVAEGDPIPARSAVLVGITLTPVKVGGIVVVDRGIAHRANGQAAIEALVREDAGRSLDGAYLSTTSGGLLYNVTPITPDVAEGREAMQNDLAAAASAAAANGSGNVSIIVAPARFAKVRVMMPDFALPLFASIAVPSDRVIAVDGSALVHGFGSEPDIEAANTATVHMDTAPTGISEATGGPVRAMWQTDSIGIRCVLDIAFAKRTATCAAYIDGIANW